MDLSKVLTVAALALIIAFFGMVAGGLTVFAEAVESQLISCDCINCHLDEPRDISEAGHAHRSIITCVDCHQGHPPRSLEVIPSCSQCHTESDHFNDLKACFDCHRNPHRPLEIKLERYLTAPCLPCHEDQGQQLKDFKSYHSSLDCTSCHERFHGNVPECTDCHKPHAESMVEEDCHKCHQAHKPLAVAFTTDLSSSDCRGCHKQAFNALSNSTAKHNASTCVDCHETEHGMVPACQDCHGTPHPAQMLTKFPGCGTCHNIAHDLAK